jgi:hypothetical protein
VVLAHTLVPLLQLALLAVQTFAHSLITSLEWMMVSQRRQNKTKSLSFSSILPVHHRLLHCLLQRPLSLLCSPADTTSRISTRRLDRLSLARRSQSNHVHHFCCPKIRSVTAFNPDTTTRCPSKPHHHQTRRVPFAPSTFQVVLCTSTSQQVNLMLPYRPCIHTLVLFSIHTTH